MRLLILKWVHIYEMNFVPAHSTQKNVLILELISGRTKIIILISAEISTMNKLFLLACLMTLTFAQNWTLPTENPLGTGSFPLIDNLIQKANQMAGDFAKDPCVQKISLEMQMGAVECLYSWKQERNLLNTINCGYKVTTKAKDKLKNDCKVDFGPLN